MDYSSHGVIDTENYYEHCAINILSLSSVVISMMRIVPMLIYTPILLDQIFSNFHIFYIIVFVVSMQHPNMLWNEFLYVTNSIDKSYEVRMKHYCAQYLNFKFKTWYFLFGQIYLTMVLAQSDIHGNITISRLISFDKRITSLDQTILLAELVPFWADFGFFVLLGIYNVFVSIRRFHNDHKFKQIDQIMLESQLHTNHPYVSMHEDSGIDDF